MALKEEKVLVTGGKKKASVRKEANAVSGMRVTIVPKNQTAMPPHHPSHPSGFSKRQTEPGETRCKKSWDRFEKYGSLSLPTLRQASIREKKGLSLGKIQVKHPQQRSPCAMKFEDGSHEKTERQQRCARSKPWNLAKNIYKLKENHKTTFYSPAEEWILSAASTKEPEEREFVVDSKASMHMVSKRYLNSAELETMRTSRSPTVMTANGEVQTREEATVYVKELDLFVTVMLS